MGRDTSGALVPWLLVFKGKGKDAVVLQWSVGGVLISLSRSLSP